MTVELREAKGFLEAAEKKAGEMGVQVSAAVVDAAGVLVALVRMEGARSFTPNLAVGKAKAAAIMQSPSDAFGDAADSTVFRTINELNNGDLCFVGGGIPIVRDGHTVGALGISGALESEDVQIGQSVLGGS